MRTRRSVPELLARRMYTSADLQARVGKSQARVSMAIIALGDRVCKIGAARSMRYALAGPILGAAAAQPLNCLGGEAHPVR